MTPHHSLGVRRNGYPYDTTEDDGTRHNIRRRSDILSSTLQLLHTWNSNRPGIVDDVCHVCHVYRLRISFCMMQKMFIGPEDCEYCQESVMGERNGSIWDLHKSRPRYIWRELCILYQQCRVVVLIDHPSIVTQF